MTEGIKTEGDFGCVPWFHFLQRESQKTVLTQEGTVF